MHTFLHCSSSLFFGLIYLIFAITILEVVVVVTKIEVVEIVLEAEFFLELSKFLLSFLPINQNKKPLWLNVHIKNTHNMISRVPNL